MSAQHSPGPWMPARGANGASCRHPAILCDGGQVATATWQGSEAATDANARLIAAAPELLEALKRLSFAAMSRDNTMGDPSALLAAKAELHAANQQAIAAIAMATKESA